MARTFHVYPKATLVGDVWKLIVKVYEPSTKANWRFIHDLAAGVTATTNLVELKISFDLITDDSDTPQDVDDSLYLDDIKPGGGVETVWGNWQDRAEGIIAVLPASYTIRDYWSDWTQQDTAAVRSDARRALITQRGWSIPFIHWHEGDGTSGDGVG